MKGSRIIAFFCLIVGSACHAGAQTTGIDSSVGFPTNGMFDGSSVESVQVNNGNLHVEIPIWSYTGRNGVKSGVSFVYDSKGWYLYQLQEGTNFVNDIMPEQGNTLQLSPVVLGAAPEGTSQVFITDPPSYFECSGNEVEYYYTYGYVARDPDGTKHQLVPDEVTHIQNALPCIPNGDILYANDGSGLLLQNAGFYTKHGTINSEDSNGNFVIENSDGTYTDTLGRTFYSDGSYVDSAGTKHPLTITTESVIVSTSLCMAGEDSCEEYPATWTVPHIITLPNGLSYTINYFQNAEGEIQSITFPTGATVSYTYGYRDNAGPKVATRTVTVGSQVSTWTYTYPTTYPVPNPESISVRDPEGNTTAYSCTRLGSGLSIEPGQQTFMAPCWITEADYYSGAATGTPIKKVTTQYNNPGIILPTSVITTWPATNQVSEVDTTYDSQSIQIGVVNGIETGNFTWGNVTDKYEYDYGSGSKGALLRHTHRDYLHLPSSDPNISNPNWQQYQAVNIADRPLSDIVYDGSGNAVAHTYYHYDEGMVTGTNDVAANHDSNYDSSHAVRGNLTSTYRWIDTAGNQKAVTSYTYNDLGDRLTETDPDNHLTTYTYTDNFMDTSCLSTGKPTLAFPTQVQDALGYVTKTSYYYCTGQMASQQDPNDIAASRAGTVYTYDSMNRQKTVSYPDTGLLTYSYSDAVPYSIGKTRTMTGTESEATTQIFDGLGRLSQTQVNGDPNTDDYVDISYDQLGRLQSKSNPYRLSAPGQTNGTTSYLYDAIGRLCLTVPPGGTAQSSCPTAAVSGDVAAIYSDNCTTSFDESSHGRKTCTDGAGRLTGVWEDPAGLNYETDYKYNPLDDLLGVGQWGGPSGSTGERVRSFTYDGLGRLLCASNPENSVNQCPAAGGAIPSGGVTSYTYDNAGNVLSKVDARGAAAGGVSYCYDSLNRVVSKSYLQQSCPMSTPDVTYSYDTSPVSGNANTIRRLTAEKTFVNGSLSTERQPYAYDPVGRLTAELQCTPGNCSGTSNSLQYTYDLAGNLTSSTNGVSNPGVQITNTYDQAAHLQTVSSTWSDSTHPPTLFSATTSSATACGFSGVPSYDAGNQLQYAQIAINAQSQAAMTATRCYDNRMRPTSETDSGLVSTPVPATVTVTVSGAEQSIGGSGTPTQATATISFTDSGAQVVRAQPLFLSNSITLPDGYHVSFVTPVATAIGVANSLAAVLNEPSSPVTAVVSSGGTASAASLVLTSKSTGADENGAITLTLTSPAVKAAPASMSGGAGATYDTGTVTANINGTVVSTAYGQSSTPETVAAALAVAISGAGAGVTAVAGGSGAIAVTANQAGTAGNGISVTLSSASNQPKYFSAASFTGTSGTLSGGAAGPSVPGTIYQYTIPAPSPTTGYAPNGNLLSYSDCVTGGDCITGAWSFSYSSLNQLSGGTATSGPWSTLSMGWTYDAFGNRTGQTASASGSLQEPVPPSQSWIYNTNNQTTLSSYDPSGVGFVTGDVSNQYVYDHEGRLCAVSNVDQGSRQYIYDAEGRRVANGTIGLLSCNPANNGFALKESYILGQSGEHISELDGSGNFVRGHVYANGQLLATYTNAGTEFAFSDWLGSKRVVANAAGSKTGSCINLPFGDELLCGGSVGLHGHHFTGQIHDAESGNDYFGARYYSEYTGRFMSPDSYGGRLADPQSLNKYAYARNNPLIYVDPDGHDFNLTGCGTTNTATCNNNMVGTTSTDGKNTFTATVISNGANGLQDQAGNAYSGTVTSAGVSFSQNGSNTSYGGSWINESNDTSFSQTGGALNGFSFNFSQPNTATGQTLAGTFSYGDNMSASQAGKALEAAGFSHSYFDAIANPLHGYDVTHYRGGGDPKTGAGAAHFILDDPYKVDDGFVMGPVRAGDFHYGETDPRVAPIQHIMHDVIPSFFTPH